MTYVWEVLIFNGGQEIDYICEVVVDIISLFRQMFS
jgi:hypothetical protein